MKANLKKYSQANDTVFTARGTDSSRLEQLSDGVIALSITLLLVSLETPKTGDELLFFASDFLAFALSTIVLITIWYMHHLFFLRFGLRDKMIMLINSGLLVVVLFFVYPLKFIISFLLQYLKFIFLMLFDFAYDRQAFVQLVTEVSSWEKLPFIMMIYSAGYVALMLSFALFYRHALKKREELLLNQAEVEKAEQTMMVYFIQCSVAGLSISIAFGSLFTPIPWLSLLAGMIYFLIGPLVYFFGKRYAKKKSKQNEQLEKSIS